MNIVVLDGYRLNPGDLSWDALRSLGHCTIHDRTPVELVLARATGADALLTNKVILGPQHFDALPLLRYIGVLATGTNVVDLAAAAARNICVTNVPTYGTRSVAQMTFALLLELTQNVGHHAQTVRHGRWAACPDFCYWDRSLIELDGLTMGLVGLGRIGRQVATLARAFGMHVLGHDPSAAQPIEGLHRVSLETLLQRSDVVSLHCPLTADNVGLIDARHLAMMKPTALLINTARGGLINEADLAAALNGELIAGAGLDVLSSEPPRADNPLLTARNCMITPHISWATRAARQRLMQTVVENLAAFAQGQRKNVVSA